MGKKDNNEIINNQCKRRSKNDDDGRNYICEICGKRYLSYPSWYTHTHKKHNIEKPSINGKRGRPRKHKENEKYKKKEEEDISYKEFISSAERSGTTEKSEINNCVDEAFKELYNQDNKKKIDSRGIKFYYSINEHPFLSKFIKDEHDLDKKEQIKNISDLVFIEYLNKMSKKFNKKFYTKLIKFVILFREYANYININNENVKNNKKEYTELFPAEDIPKLSNDFINYFIDPEEKKEDLGFSEEECINLTKSVCSWMWDNNFTVNKLFDRNNEKNKNK